MARTVSKPSPSTLLSTVEPRMAKASIAVNSAESPNDFAFIADPVSLFFETIAVIGMSEKEAAYTMAMDPAQLSRVKSGQARLPFDAMWRLPATFWVELRNRIEMAKGLNPARVRELRAARIGELVKLLVEVA